MKYWGKKPHNIWREFIECYSPENGTVLDSFAESGIAAFEGVVANRKMITLDINPMSSFFIEVTTIPFDEILFSQAAHDIISIVEQDEIYQQHYIRTQNEMPLTIYNYIWKDEKIWKIHAKNHDEEPFSIQPSEIDAQLLDNIEYIDIPYWYPQDQFPNTPSIKGKFIKDIGGSSFSYLWTRRNLYR